MKNMKISVALGLFAVMTAVSLPMSAQAADASAKIGEHVNPINAEYEDCDTIAFPDNRSMEDYIMGLDMLTKSEKATLIRAEKEKEPLYRELNAVWDELEKKTAEIVKEADPIIDEAFRIKEKHAKLWKKVESRENEEQKKVEDDFIKFIQLSDTVTQKEKDILINDQKKIDKLYKKVDACYDKAKEATKDLQKKLDDTRTKIQAIDKKTDVIWDKVYGE